MSAKILATKIVYDGWAKYLLAKVRLGDGHVAEREIVEREACVSVLPYDAKRKVALLVRQFRAPVLMKTGEQELLEAVAGMCDGGDAKDARRNVDVAGRVNRADVPLSGAVHRRGFRERRRRRRWRA